MNTSSVTNSDHEFASANSQSTILIYLDSLRRQVTKAEILSRRL